MKEKLVAIDWLFAIKEAPVFAGISGDSKMEYIRLPQRKALIAADTGRIVGIVGENYRVFTNQEAIALCQKFCIEAFPDTKASEWDYQLGHGPSTRSWAALDVRHCSHIMNLYDLPGGKSDTYTPFARITNSYNGSRALRIDIGFMRTHCNNGVIFEQQAANISVPHTREGIHKIEISSPFKGLSELCDKFRETINGVRSIGVTSDEAQRIVCEIVGWPVLSKNPKPSEKTDQEALDADLKSRVQKYFKELGENAYAVFNIMTDIATHLPQSSRFRLDRPNLERRAGAWLRDFKKFASRPDFTLPRYLVEMTVRKGPSQVGSPRFR